MGKVILLTGAPSVGKSTLRRSLASQYPELVHFDYGELLRQKKENEGKCLSYEQMRAQSAGLIHTNDVHSLDEYLIGKVAELRQKHDIIIDSHAVTREHFGFRAVPFSMEQLGRLNLDGVIALRCSAETMLSRMAIVPEGRQEVSAPLAVEHQVLQECVGMIYAVMSGCPIFILDVTDLNESEVALRAVQLLDKIGLDINHKQLE